MEVYGVEYSEILNLVGDQSNNVRNLDLDITLRRIIVCAVRRAKLCHAGP